MMTFSTTIAIIGVNPYVLVPKKILVDLFKQAGKDKGPIPIKGTLNGYPYSQTLVKFSGKWRLYLNTPMRQAAGLDVGDHAEFAIVFDPEERTISMHPALKTALSKNKIAQQKFVALPAYYQKEIIRYIHKLKSAAAIERNVDKAIQHLLGKERFIGRDDTKI